MPQAQQKTAARKAKKPVAAQIAELLEREKMALSITRIQIFEKVGDRLIPGGELSPSVIARLLRLPEGSTIIPQVEVKPALNGKNAR